MEAGSINSYQQLAAVEALGAEQAADQGVVNSKNNELGMDDFFKLLTTQLISQDPLKPMENTEFISQMANFSSLTQMESIAENMTGVREQQESLAVMSLMGREIVADDGAGELIRGTVTQVEWVGGKLIPFIDDTEIPYKSIISISEPEVAELETPTDDLAVMSLMGREIVAEDGAGGFIQGKVTRVEWIEGELIPYIGDTQVPYKSIVSISDPEVVEPQTPTDA